MLKLFYLENNTWEYDFIINDLLHNIDIEIELIKPYNLLSLLEQKEHIEKNILVISNFCKFEEVYYVIKNIKPIATFYLSDEFGTNPNITILDKYTKLFFRQYNHKHYKYFDNNYHSPLGYSKYFLKNKRSDETVTKKIKDRTINCSFIGTMKSDRLVMINIFQEKMKNTNIQIIENNWNIDKLPYPPEKCFEIYNDSIFVICGRGNYSLNCFRIYEAIVAGSIPVIVGQEEEIKSEFTYNETIPPFIYDESWEKVVEKCNQLLENQEELQKIQDNLLLWWKNQIYFINSLIRKEIEALKSD
jgi:hypothetical protein